MRTLTLEQLRATTEAGGVAGVTLKAQGGTFFVNIATRTGGQVVLAKARSSEPRGFANPVQALTLLRNLGLVAGTFDVEAWDPHDTARARTRPDRANALKQTHQAAEYDRWFREQARQGLAEADDPDTVWVSQHTVKDDMQRQRKALQVRIDGIPD